jgi:hypothetical protein
MTAGNNVDILRRLGLKLETDTREFRGIYRPAHAG